MTSIEKYSDRIFENIKQINEYGQEFWYARELQEVLEYSQWRNFYEAVQRAALSCENSGYDIDEHFEECEAVRKIGNGANRKVKDIKLSRYACYLIVMNGDPQKEIISLGQTYFAVKTRQQELSENFDSLSEDAKRLAIRNELKRHNSMLADAAHDAGVVEQRDYAIFQNYGYKGLYGGLGAKEIHNKKGLKKSQKILDYMGSTELAANLFRATQTEEKLRRDNIKGKQEANQTHYHVGKKVRETIKELGGTMPEDLPTPEKSIQQIEKEQMQRLKKPSDSRQRNIILTFIRVIKSVRRSLRRLRRPMPYCLIRIRDASMISSVMQHLMAQAAEPVALISQAWIWGIFLVTFSEISSEVEEAVAEEMVLHRVQMSVSV